MIVELAVPGESCPCSTSHRPAALVLENHHVLPLSWGGADSPANRVRICAQAHYNTHAMLNRFVHAGAPVPRAAGWPRFSYTLAMQAWARRIPGHPTPYW